MESHEFQREPSQLVKHTLRPASSSTFTVSRIEEPDVTISSITNTLSPANIYGLVHKRFSRSRSVPSFTMKSRGNALQGHISTGEAIKYYSDAVMHANSHGSSREQTLTIYSFDNLLCAIGFRFFTTHQHGLMCFRRDASGYRKRGVRYAAEVIAAQIRGLHGLLDLEYENRRRSISVAPLSLQDSRVE